MVGIFDPACEQLPPWTKKLCTCVLLPLYLLYDPPPLPIQNVQYMQTVCDCGRVDVSLTDVSPTENSLMLRPLNKASLGYYALDRCVPTLDRVKHGTSSVGLGHPPAPAGSVGRLAGFAYAPDQVY
jgi:hypothetical protein